MASLGHNDEVAQLFRVIEDALRRLQCGHAKGAELALRNAVEKKQLSECYKGPRITYLR